MDQL
jgi:hypothetical protein